MAERVVVFLDYQNVHHGARRQFLPSSAQASDGHVSPELLGKLLVSRRHRPSELTQVRVYRGRPNPERQPRAARANDRQTSAWERAHPVTVIRRNLQYLDMYDPPRVSEKGIDVAIAVDMIRLCLTSSIDVAILFSSDRDLLPAVELLSGMSNCHVEVAAWSGAPRIRIAETRTPWCHYLQADDFHAVRDTVDYAAG